MADYTILRNSDEDNRSTVVIEFPVPATSNTALVPWQTIVAEVRAASGDTSTRNPRKVDDSVYVAQLDAGEIVELGLTVEYNANATDVAKLAVIDAAVTSEVASFTADFAAEYEFYGTERTV